MFRDLPSGPNNPLDAIELTQLLSQAREAVVYVDSDWIVRYCNDVYLENVGLSLDRVVGRTPSEFVPSFRRSIFYETIETCRRERRPMARIGYSTALNRWLMVRVFPVGSGMVMLANDASETVVKQYQLAQQALKDTLTGLSNKLALVQDMHARLAEDRAFTLIVLGLNRFKSINDAQGYARGDLALLEVASRLQTATVAGEQLYRLNSDEFACITRGDEAHVRERARCLQHQTRLPIVLNGQVFVLGSAAGAVPAPEHGSDPELLLKRAALALRQAKRAGPDEVQLYEPHLEKAARLRTELEADLRVAVEAGQFVLMLQPKGCLSRHNVIGAEALIRWRHPELGLVSPGDFLPVAQECGLMRAIDNWVLREALAQVQHLKQRGLAVPVSINLSVESLGDPGLVDNVRDALAEAGVEPRLLEVEIPEGSLMRDAQTSARVLAGLDDLGIGISIDDFGTGYSSFAYLARFPVHTLKVDRSFVTEMTSSEASRTIVKGLVRLAHSLSLRVVAEGAETAEQIEMLQRLRCDEVQGYAYAKPMPLPQFCEFAQAHCRPSGPSPFTI
jgi:diguanylate cyclase (GGDEF)-like protein/PAS domain S-box-containing protein